MVHEKQLATALQFFLTRHSLSLRHIPLYNKKKKVKTVYKHGVPTQYLRKKSTTLSELFKKGNNTSRINHSLPMAAEKIGKHNDGP